MLKSREFGRLSLRAIHDLERAIRVWEMVLEGTQLIVNEKIVCYEKREGAVDTSPTLARARANIAAYNKAILGAKARIEELEREN